MISVVIPLYNKESLISNTIQTVLNQTLQDFEIVVINDGSTDNSVAEVKKIDDSRIRIINQKNSGVSAARNRGIHEAKGDFIALLDGDDEWKPDYLKTQFELTQKYPECDVFAMNYEFQDINGKKTPTIINKLPFKDVDGVLSNYFEVASCSHPPICSISVMARKGIFESVGGFPQGIKSGEDLLTWARLACRYKIAYCKTPLATFVFDPKGFDQNQKERFPEKVDFVGNELTKLKDTYQQTGMRKYIALWHKMRCRIFIQKGFHGKALKEGLKSAKLSLNAKIVVFLALSVLPTSFSNKIFK